MRRGYSLQDNDKEILIPIMVYIIADMMEKLHYL